MRPELLFCVSQESGGDRQTWRTCRRTQPGIGTMIDSCEGEEDRQNQTASRWHEGPTSESEDALEKILENILENTLENI